MYSTCLFCSGPLGANAVLETFPVGRRLAFDAARGRLWVVCRHCERWNLSPIEERWEAVEDCERLFRETRTRVSTENIGLARLAAGLELVRVGPALRPEFAAWRYGDQFGRRRRRAMLYGAGGVLALGTIGMGAAAAGLISGTLVFQSTNIINLATSYRTAVRTRLPDGKLIRLRRKDLVGTGFLAPGEDEPLRILVRAGRKKRIYEGADAEHLAALVLPQVNRSGARRSAVQDAVQRIEAAGGPEDFIHSELNDPDWRRMSLGPWQTPPVLFAPGGERMFRVAKLPSPIRLALEMALHEERERRALEGELKALELAWRDAEEVAAIADDLVLPPGTDEFLERHRPPLRE